MKKFYKKPALRFINLDTEGMIANSFKSSDVTLDRDATSNEETLLTDKKNFWGDEGIWK